MNPSEDPRLDVWAGHLERREQPEPLDPGTPPAADLDPVERDALDSVARRLADEALWSGPPPELRARLLAQAGREQTDAVPPTRTGHRPVRRWLLVAAAAAVVSVGGAVLWPRGPATEFALAGTAAAPAASATAELTPKSAGLAIQLHITGLRPAPDGTYYAAWLRGPDGVVPVGSFHWRKGGIPIDLWSGVTSDRYPELFVTLQSETAGPGPSDIVVLDGRTGP
ncbi:anti-sigma factor domain-containing protein [Kineosporia sp. A_224]|uniref:anti-sigma factor domain-containing protein n=1 Tax=Kineosporia sp. A_224 TaxID=1962180 RepID=UPI000B4B2780|nr:anti-sigma factor [Kineosporia sp. A_224]